ncbi:MAG: hypothetical protein HXX20_22865 [Chloroflexi bacterium]|nr:hypothetical protein [Chloroflexota bacterium]
MSQPPYQPPQGWPPSDQSQPPYGAPPPPYGQQPPPYNQPGQPPYGAPPPYGTPPGQPPYGAPPSQPPYGQQQQQQYGQPPYGAPPPYGVQPPYGQPATGTGSSGLQPNIASLLAYLFLALGGLVFLAIEKNNQEVRFNALQSLILCGAYLVFTTFLGVFLTIIHLGFLVNLVNLAYFGGSIYLMVMAYQGRHIKLPIIGDIAERNAATFMR